MSQLIYLLVIFFMTFILSSVYLWCIQVNKVVKLIFIILSVFIFSIVCYLYNCFIFNEYVVLTILYSIYFSNFVKIAVKRKFSSILKVK